MNENKIRKKETANFSLRMTESFNRDIDNFCRDNYVSKVKLFEISLQEYFEKHKDKFA